MLADGETQDIGGTGKGETVDGDVVGDFVLFLEDKVLELVGDEDLSGLCDLSVSVYSHVRIHMNPGLNATYCYHPRA